MSLAAPLLPRPSANASANAAHGGVNFPRDRQATERVTIREYRNMTDLMDQVKHTRLQAALDAIKAGNVGGSGLMAQIIFINGGFVTLGMSVVLVVYVAIGQITLTQLFAGGFWLLFSFPWPLYTYARCLRRLEAHENMCTTTNSKTAKDLERTIRWITSLLVVLTALMGIFFVWTGLYYGISGGAINMWPLFPSAPTRAFTISFGVLVPLAGLGSFLGAGMIYLGRIKRVQHIILGVVFYGGFILAPALAILAEDATIWPRLVLGALGIFVASCLLAFYFYMHLKRRWALTREMRADMAAYEEAWSAIRSNPVQLQGLAEIEAMLLYSSCHGTMRRTSLYHLSTTEQLLKLFTEAWVLNDKFQRILAAWKSGATSSRTSATHGDNESKQVQLPVAAPPADLAAAHPAVQPKRRKRAIEKVFRSYNGNAACLRDLVRGSIVFDTVGELKACLAVILADANVRIHKVKNRFAEKYDAMKESLGYRDMQLSVTFVESCFTPEELAMELHEHVCEVQLHLRPIYALKNDEGHKRYVQFRNARAE